ncbi:hypothetical protein Glove_281g44 [Diversispora epigaea]|uniref:Uncharacterized protein n=1 Tax=Diversispora epigaea TaxID=1348612 RepID=A0A397I1Y9_9GLOM|nr:hypothetical protein Glove_281g44 [Diversispora epigaea]
MSRRFYTSGRLTILKTRNLCASMQFNEEAANIKLNLAHVFTSSPGLQRISLNFLKVVLIMMFRSESKTLYLRRFIKVIQLFCKPVVLTLKRNSTKLFH